MKPVHDMTAKELVAYALTLKDEFEIAKALNKAFGDGFSHAMDKMEERYAA